MAGKDYKDQDLSGTDFSNSDIRGADFSNAVLHGANFSESIAGPEQSWIAIISLIGSVGMAIASLITGFAGGFIGLLMFDDFEDYEADTLLFRIVSVVFFIALAATLFFFIRQGFGKNLGYFFIGVIVLIVIVAISVVLGSAGVAVAATLLILTLAFPIVAAIILSFSQSTIYFAFGQKAAVVFTVLAFAFWIPGAMEVLEGIFTENPDIQSGLKSYTIPGIVVAGLVVFILFLSSIYISKQVVSGNPKFSILTQATIDWIALKGTSFREADLSGADFTGAYVEGVDFRSANLTRTCFYGAQKLERARMHETYLKDAEIRELVVGKYGKDGDFAKQNLRGVNLKGADLKQANFVGTNLSRATLENADLSGAKLAMAQLYHTDLTGANLTGAVIQDWAISTDTVLEDIECDYIFMKLPTEDDPDPWRKPDNRNEHFQEGDFSDFIAPIVKTLGLYQQQNVDPRKMAGAFKTLDLFHYEGINSAAAAISLKQLAEEHPEAELEVIALEGRGEERIRLQTTVSEDVDRSRLSERYSEMYKEYSSLPDDKIQALLAAMAEKDDRIQSLESMVLAAVKTEKLYVETNYVLGDQISVGDISGSSNIAIGRNAST